MVYQVLLMVLKGRDRVDARSCGVSLQWQAIMASRVMKARNVFGTPPKHVPSPRTPFQVKPRRWR